MNKRNPYYKEYKKNPLVKKPVYSFKLPEDVKEDFDEYLKAFPNPNKAMLELIIDILNSKCTERKYFNIDVISILPYTYLNEKLNKGLYLAVKDNYLIEREGLPNDSSSIILNNETYLNPSKEIDLEDFSTMLNNYHFTGSGIEPIDYLYLEEAIEEYYLSNDFSFEDYSLVHFKINNFLDEFIENEYKAANGNHKGIGYFQSKFYDELSFFTYEWKFGKDFSFELVDIGLISENDFKALILNSSNEDLKQFLKDFKDLSSYAAVPSNVSEVDDLKQRVKNLQNELDEVYKYADLLKEENQFLYEKGYEQGKDETEESIRNRFRELVKGIEERNKA